MTLELTDTRNKFRDQREYVVIPEHENAKCDTIRIIVRTLSQMIDETILTAT